MATETGAAPHVLAEGLAFPEGPLFDVEGLLWCVEVKGEGLCTFHESGIDRVRTGGVPNGLALGSQGRIYFADSGENSIRRFDPTSGRIDTVVHQAEAKALDKPNDLAFDPAGNLVFTCPGNSRTEPTGYVCLATREGACRKIAEGLYFPNGLAFTPTGKELVIAETYRHRLWRGGWDKLAGRWIEPAPWASVGGPIGPDGMAFGADGLLYVAVYGQRVIMAFGADGAFVKSFATIGANPTNVAFDPTGRLGLVVTEAERGELVSFPGLGKGASLFKGELDL